MAAAVEGVPVSAPQLSLLACFLVGLRWVWLEQREFLLAFIALALAAVALGIWASDGYLIAGGLAIFGALGSACLVYGSHR